MCIRERHHPYQRHPRSRRNSEIEDEHAHSINFNNLIRIQRTDSNRNLFQRQINQQTPEQYIERTDADQETLDQHANQQHLHQLHQQGVELQQQALIMPNAHQQEQQ